MANPGRDSDLYGRSPAQAQGDLALVALACTQHAVFEIDQLPGVGLTAKMLYRRVAACRLHHVYQRVYSLVPPELLSREGRWMAAVLACGAGAVLSHRSAAALLGLRPAGGVRIDVTVPSRSRRQPPGVNVHRSNTLTPEDTTREDNIPCTTIARTQLDIADVLSRRQIERAFDQAEISG